ncbi:MAG TPA: tetratricopeptide repeat protein [Chryseosolibacter sp.]|nr:tetratricopeptide repeat protein [Chryseosolibacter sp.]
MHIIQWYTVAVLMFCTSLFAQRTAAQSKEQLDSLNMEAKALACRQPAKSDSISDIVIAAAKRTGHDAQRAYALKNKSQNQICASDFKSAIVTLNQAVSIFKKVNDAKGEAEAYNNLTAAHRSLSQTDSAKFYNSMQQKIAIAINDSLLLMAAYQMKSGIHTVLSENDSIIFYAIKGLAIAERMKNKRYEGTLAIAIGNAYYQNEDFEPALAYFKQAKDVLLASNNHLHLNVIYHNIATSFSKLRQPDSAFTYYQKSIALNVSQNNKYNLAYNYQGIADAYYNVGNYEKAISYNILSKNISEALNEKLNLATVLSNLSACYTKTNNYHMAIVLARQAITIFKEIGELDKEADAHWLLSDAYRKTGNFEAAFASFKDFYSIDSMLLNKEKSRTMFELETRYQTEKKDLEITALAQSASIKDLEIRQKNLSMIIGVIVISLVALFVYLVYRQRTLTERQKQAELEQRFLRSQLNPHFISNALMAIQNYMLKNEAVKAAGYLAKFAKLMREILENSRQEFIPVADEIQMLTNYLDIHRVRMNESFDYTVEVSETINQETEAIPPMFVQPFVENAIEHGITNAAAKGAIRLKLVKDGDYISIEITDNGGGMIVKNNVAKEHESLSTKIIQERIAIFNRSLKKKIRLVWEDVLNERGEVNGTRVALKVPYSYV